MRLEDTSLSVNVLRLLISAVSEKLSIRHFTLLREESGEQIQRLLQPMPAPTLREVDMQLRDTKLSVNVLRLLVSAVSEKLSIRYFTLLREESGEHIQRLLQPMPAPTLREVDMQLEDTKLSVNVLRLLISAVSEKLSIQYFTLLREESGEHIQSLLQPMPVPTVREIDMQLRHTTLSVNVLRLLISAVSEKLSIHCFTLLCEESGEYIQRLLQPTPEPTLREIDMQLRDTRLSVNVLQLLISAVSEKLSIHDFTLLREESGEHIQRLLQPMPAPTLREIDMQLRDTRLSVNVLRLLISAVSEKLSIHDFTLLREESGEHIQRLLQPMLAPTLREIDMQLRDTDLSVNVLRLLISAVSEKLSIRHFTLLREEIGEHMQRLLQPMPAPTLREIDMQLKDTDLSVNVLRLLISAVSEKLSIHDFTLLREQSGEHIQRLLQPTPEPTLREIDMQLRDTRLSVNVLQLLISAVSEKLSIHDFTLLREESGEHIQRLLQPMPAPTLREIDMQLRDTRLSVNVLRLLISAVSEKLSIHDFTLLREESGEHIQRLLQPMLAPTLREIDMQLRDTDLSVNVLRLLISAVSEKLSIRHFTLLREEIGEHMQRLLQPMPAPTLREIDMQLKDTDLSVNVLRLLISAVSEKLSIHDFTLLREEIGEHIQRLLQPMPAPTLREIDMQLRDTRLSVNVLRFLISSVSEKLSIRYFTLLREESGEHIQRLLQPMPAPTLREIDMQLRDTLSVNVLRLLISAVSEKLSIRYFTLLREESGDYIQTLLQPMPAPTLREIDMQLTDTRLSVNVLRFLISAVSEKLSIHRVTLLREESGEHIQRLLQPMPAPTLREIYMLLSRTTLSVNVLRLLLSAVSEKLSITCLTLLREESGEHIQRLLQPMPAPTLREIDMLLIHATLSVNVLRLLISAVSEKLSIRCFALLCEESGEHTQRLLQPMPAPTLREIDMQLSDTDLSVNVLRLLISAVSEKLSIRHFTLLREEIGEHIQRQLQTMPAPTLREIDIGHSALSVDAVQLLISAVRENLSIEKCTLLCSGEKEGRGKVLYRTRSVSTPTLRVELRYCLKDQSGRRLTDKAAKQTVRDICPSATVTTKYWVSERTEFTLNTTRAFSSFPAWQMSKFYKQKDLPVR